jgi:hypothetical protein
VDGKRIGMDAIDFVLDYPKLLTELEEIIRPEYTHLIERLREQDPHDLVVDPEMEFDSIIDAIIYIWKILVRDFLKRDYFPLN